MSYINAKNVLPEDVITLIQHYFEGDYLYIPKRDQAKKAWGDNTTTRTELAKRNAAIYEEAKAGCSTSNLANKYFLSVKSIQRILAQMKMNKEA